MRGRSAQRGASEPLAGRASPGRVVVQHLILSLKLGNPVLDEVTDRDDPAEPTVLDDRHMPDPVVSHPLHQLPYGARSGAGDHPGGHTASGRWTRVEDS